MQIAKRYQQFTPETVINEMLDNIGYDTNICGKRVFENSCGDGRILKAVVGRYIDDARKKGWEDEKIADRLGRDICACEIDLDVCRQCVRNLDEFIRSKEIPHVYWSVMCCDALKKPFINKFDFVIGNPPYIAYKDLDIADRQFIKLEYDTCKKGKPDYFYAFLENAIEYLEENGRLAYLIPNSIFKNVFAEILRKKIKPYLYRIIDYPNNRLFKAAATSCSAIFCDRGQQVNRIEYINHNSKVTIHVNKEDLHGKWYFVERCDLSGDSFGDFFHASMGVATLKNEVFVLSKEQIEELQLEPLCVRPATSPKYAKRNEKLFIIFPYKYEKGSLQHYSETDMIKLFPHVYSYLTTQKELLGKRAIDKNVKWYEYGRTQALNKINCDKLMLSTVITRNIEIFKLSDITVPFSGMFIRSIGEIDLTVAQKILESKEFKEYIYSIGTHVNGTSVRITAKDINNFRFSIQKYIE